MGGSCQHDGAGKYAAHEAALAAIWSALGGDPDWLARLDMTGEGGLPSIFPVSSLASASVGAACLAVAELMSCGDGIARRASVDRRLASFWFGRSIRPQGWSLAPGWDALAGDYRTADGWIKLHTNAPHHRAAALAALDVAGERDAVTQAVGRWQAAALEQAVLDRGGCAAAMMGLSAWAAHPQGIAVAAEPLLHGETTDVVSPSRWRPSSQRPLAGVRVLDMTRVLAGPVATRFLAGFGADVLRIDPPDWDEPGVVPDVTLGKRCARLDLRRDLGLFETLLAKADVLVHGYRPGALDRLGLSEERRQSLRPGLIDVSLDAYGWTGPWRSRRGFDSLVQMSSGIADAGMQASGSDSPEPLPVQALDHATGYIMAAAALRGLTRRLSSGTGSAMQASLARTAALLTALPTEAADALPDETPDDLVHRPEETSWGPAKRVRSPCLIEEVTLHWDRPATALGSTQATWLE